MIEKRNKDIVSRKDRMNVNDLKTVGLKLQIFLVTLIFCQFSADINMFPTYPIMHFFFNEVGCQNTPSASGPAVTFSRFANPWGNT